MILYKPSKKSTKNTQKDTISLDKVNSYYIKYGFALIKKDTTVEEFNGKSSSNRTRDRLRKAV